VADLFLNETSLLQLIGVVSMELNEKWETGNKVSANGRGEYTGAYL